MLRDEILNLESGNRFVDNNKIPLGINTWRGNRLDKKPVVELDYQKNGSIVIIATSGWGKSVLIKRIIDYKLGLFQTGRAGLVIDTQGVDHRLLRLPNLFYKPLFVNYGERPSGIKKIKNYCPVFASNLNVENDEVWGITLNDLDSSDLMSSQLSMQAVTEIFKIKQQSMNNRKIMDKPMTFYLNFAKIKASKTDTGDSELDYNEMFMNYGLKMSILNSFSWWAGFEPKEEERRPYETEEEFNMKTRSPYFINVTDKRYLPVFKEDWDNRVITIQNFMEARREREGMSIYGGYLLRQAFNYCKMRKRKYGKRFPGMDIIVEESNLFIDEDIRKGCNYYFTELLCRGFKYEVGLIANFQNITGINRDIKEHLTSGSNPVIVGKLTLSDREFLNNMFPNIKGLNLRSKDKLDSNYQWGGNEWAVYYNDQEYDTFVPYPSLSKIHERG